jgi:hypothetical protein
MSDNRKKTESHLDAWKNESARQRWELFHRAIAHAKESNNASLNDADAPGGDSESAGPLLSIVQ